MMVKYGWVFEMNFNLAEWDELNYQNFQNYLYSIKEDSYKDFSSKLTKTKYKILGIRVPVLRKIAKEICKGNYNSFLKCSLDDTFEEVFIQGLVISNIKDENEFLKYLANFVLKIDDWSICDSFCNSLKIVNQDLNKYFEYFTKYLSSNKEFKIRVCLIVYLNFYTKKEFVDRIIENILKIKNNDYYVEMAISWLLAEIYLVDKEKVINLLKNKKLTKFVNNKTISKLRDSYRVSKEDKEKLLNWRIK